MKNDFIKKLFANQNIWLSAGVSFLIVFVLFYFFIYPSMSTMRQISVEIHDMVGTMQLNTDNLLIRDTLKLYNRYEEKQQTFHESILANSRQLEVITALEDIATRFDIEQKINLSELERVPRTVFYTNTMQISLESDFKNTMRFLEAMEQLPFYINIEKINITRSPKKSTEDNINSISVFITAQTYWQ